MPLSLVGYLAARLSLISDGPQALKNFDLNGRGEKPGMKTMMLVISLIFMSCAVGMAQGIPQVELYGGYSWAGGNFHGWNASATFNINERFGVVADFSGHSGSSRVGNVFEERQRAYSFLFGPRVSFRKRKRVQPFVYALFGGSRLKITETFLGQTATASDTGFTMALGGGLDIRVNRRLAVRAFQLDYLRPTFFNEADNRGRLSFGLVLRLGSK